MKTCFECGENLLGRDDKKFCGDQCRSSYNNKINKDSSNFMRNINNRLRRNYRILSELNTGGKTKTSRLELLEKGFDFGYFTSMDVSKKGKYYYFLYDQGYKIANDNACKIVRKPIEHVPPNQLPR
ncbi:MAG: hypothetical protein EOO50_01345 [Flavobacterium sp.]|uniref:hypothetical protein n=1 Tax=Flavobacterium sp. TaxID=239 RepID=UPI0011F883FA|nr:hypothetical protein [Flavobacterium sp.]RZJ68465.1 MAG: hypothetical protein EOO50_01345 [Flavobacterium sp.]